MARIKNVSPFGDLEVPLLGITVAKGSIVEVTDEQAKVLLTQSDNFHPWGAEAREALERAEAEQADEPKKAGDLE